jgi:hypothetical protein
MCRKLALTFLFTFMSLWLWGQQLLVIEPVIEREAGIGEELQVRVPIKNISSKPVFFTIRKIHEQMGTNQSGKLCYGPDCILGRRYEFSGFKRLDPGEVSTQLFYVFQTGLTAAEANIKFVIILRDYPQESYPLELNFRVSDVGMGKSQLYTSTKIVIKDIYPNPVTEYAIIDYSILVDQVRNPRIIIHNLLGSVMGEYELSPYESKLKIQTAGLNPGVYFYTLYLDNDAVMTKKLIVRK